MLRFYRLKPLVSSVPIFPSYGLGIARRWNHTQADVVERAVQHMISPQSPPSEPLERRKYEIDVLKQCISLGDSAKGHELLELSLDHCDLQHPGVLHGFFTANPAPTTDMAVIALQKFNQVTAKTQLLPEVVSMIPFRRALYQADFAGAQRIMTQTVGKASHMDGYFTKKLQKKLACWAVVVLAIVWATDSLLKSGLVGDWDPSRTTMVSLMVLTYLGALTVYGSLAFAGSKAGLGSTLEWIPGTSMLYRYKHMPQLKMASMMAAMNRALPENLGEYSQKIIDDLHKLNIKPTETQTEQLLKEYWARGGDGFDWVEPDQDPADIRWWHMMEKSRTLRIGSPYVRTDGDGKALDWADDLEKWRNNQSIPHASLLEVEKLRTPEAMEKLEQDLKELSGKAKNLQLGNRKAHRLVGVEEESDSRH